MELIANYVTILFFGNNDGDNDFDDDDNVDDDDDADHPASTGEPVEILAWIRFNVH